LGFDPSAPNVQRLAVVPREIRPHFLLLNQEHDERVGLTMITALSVRAREVLAESDFVHACRIAHVEPTPEDLALEREIETVRMAATKEADTELARDYFRVMAEMIAKRSPAQIARMERERGLRAP
jgi:hypothetical protein